MSWLQRRVHWLRRHRIAAVCVGVLLLFFALNGVAFMHAYAMTHFVVGGTRTLKPEELTFAEKLQVLCTGVRIPKPINSIDPSDRGLAFTSHRFQGQDDVDYEGWHIPCSDARGLCILFHGYASCKSSLLEEADSWREMGYETFLVDFRGCGGSSGRQTTIGYYEADDVLASVQYAQLHLTEKPIILYGQSMGAAAILRAVSLFDLQPRAVIVECPFDRLLSTAENRFSVMGLPSFPFAELLVFWGSVQHGFSGFRHNPVDDAMSVDVPVLLMSGERDTRVTREQATAVFENLSGEKQLVLFPEVGHASCFAGDPDKWQRAVTDFLGEL